MHALMIVMFMTKVRMHPVKLVEKGNKGRLCSLVLTFSRKSTLWRKVAHKIGFVWSCKDGITNVNHLYFYLQRTRHMVQ